MKIASMSCIICLVACTTGLSAEVTITELADRIQVQIDGQVFTEWRHKEWVAPFLYPVVGPNGENVTRHYPMQAGAPGEEP